MNQQMWHACVTQENVEKLAKRSCLIFGPGVGEQACGDVGAGRMLDVPELVALTVSHFQERNVKEECVEDLVGQHWVITAGPTQEAY